MSKKTNIDAFDPLGSILKATPTKYNKITIETSMGKRYYSDLTFFQNIHCYPKIEEWNNVTINSDGKGLIWSSKFQLKINQVIAHCYKTENI